MNEISNIYSSETRVSVIDLKKSFLKVTINNIISEINTKRINKNVEVTSEVETIYNVFEDKYFVSAEEYNDYFISFFSDATSFGSWAAVLWDRETGKVIYDSVGTEKDTLDENIAYFEENMTAYKIIYTDDAVAMFGIPKSYVDNIIKIDIYNKLKNLRFDDNSYVWINEILDYSGGDNYAVRILHPNYPETEGDFLSTNTLDIEGNRPYLEELEGVKKSGEIFFTYYFKKLNSDVVSKKVSYARLYKDFNWVIAIGMHLDDIDSYIEVTNEKSKKIVKKHIGVLLFFIILVLIISYILIIVIEKKYYRYSRQKLEIEFNQDALTKAYTRKFGTESLKKIFEEYRQTGLNSVVMLFDVDKFKIINDTYGHCTGDQVLIELVRHVQNFIRGSDCIIRWGGDEFIVIFKGLQFERMPDFGERMLEVVSKVKVYAENEAICPTISIGFSCFKEKDFEYLDVLERADEALYKSKTEGRNRYNISC